MSKYFDERLITTRHIPLSWSLEIDPILSPKHCQKVVEIVDELTNKLSNKGGSNAKRVFIFTKLLSNLAYLISCTSTGKPITISYVTTSEVMKFNNLGRETVRDCLDVLHQEGFILLHSGHQKRGMNYSSRMKFTHNLYRRFQRLSEPVYLANKQLVVVRDADKNDVTHTMDIPDDIVEELIKINAVNATAVIKTGSGKVIAGGQFHRVFNNSDLEQGGRFYDHQIQSLPGKLRKKLTINGENVVEHDYSILHPKLLYLLKGIHIDLGFDAYTIPTVALEPVPKENRRTVLKLAVNILLNAKNLSSAKGAIVNKISSGKKPLMTVQVAKSIDIDELCEAIFCFHEPIKEYFYQGAGIFLQNVDAEIASRILRVFTDDNEPCLCVHDSFIVRKSRESDLIKAMELAYKYVVEEYIDEYIE